MLTPTREQTYMAASTVHKATTSRAHSQPKKLPRDATTNRKRNNATEIQRHREPSEANKSTQKIGMQGKEFRHTCLDTPTCTTPTPNLNNKTNTQTSKHTNKEGESSWAIVKQDHPNSMTLIQ